MTGTIVNTAAILIGGGIGLTVKKQISPGTQHLIKVGMGFFTIVVGFKIAIGGLNGSFLSILGQIGIAFLAMILGKFLGRLMRLQEMSNKAGELAKQMMSRGGSSQVQRFSDGFMTCSLLFCIGPMALLGAIQDGTTGNYGTLIVKAIMDGLSTMVFATLFGWGVLFSALPVFVYQGTVTLLSRGLAPYLENKALLDSMNVTGGLLVVAIALVILEIRKVELTNYLPSLAVAPLLTWLFRL